MNLKEIKDAARQAFSDQQTQDTEGGVPDGISFIAGFLAGARHLQNAYETLDAHDEMLIATVDKLKEENRKLVEALKFYANRFSWTESDHPTHEYYAGAIRNDDSLVEYTEADGDVFKDFCGGKLARQVLKETGEE